MQNQEAATNDECQSPPPEHGTKGEEILLLGQRAASPKDWWSDHAKPDTPHPGTSKKGG
jgi:hypothetical protein